VSNKPTSYNIYFFLVIPKYTASAPRPIRGSKLVENWREGILRRNFRSRPEAVFTYCERKRTPIEKRVLNGEKSDNFRHTLFKNLSKKTFYTPNLFSVSPNMTSPIKKD
jgi:hypothetical protein